MEFLNVADEGGAACDDEATGKFGSPELHLARAVKL